MTRKFLFLRFVYSADKKNQKDTKLLGFLEEQSLEEIRLTLENKVLRDKIEKLEKDVKLVFCF
jgi:hypothetical protein